MVNHIQRHLRTIQQAEFEPAVQLVLELLALLQGNDRSSTLLW